MGTFDRQTRVDRVFAVCCAASGQLGKRSLQLRRLRDLKTSFRRCHGGNPGNPTPRFKPEPTKAPNPETLHCAARRLWCGYEAYRAHEQGKVIVIARASNRRQIFAAVMGTMLSGPWVQGNPESHTRTRHQRISGQGSGFRVSSLGFLASGFRL